MLVILDDAETLIENKEQGDEEIAKFLDEVKTLMKEDLVKVLILCDNEETKFKAGKVLDQDLTHLNEKKPDGQITLDFEQCIMDFTGLKLEEAREFVDLFGFDIFELINLKSFIQENGNLPGNIIFKKEEGGHISFSKKE